MDLMAVTPDGNWIYWQSANLKGYPAIHVVNNKTGKNFMWEKR